MAESVLVESGELMTDTAAAKFLGRSLWWIQEKCRRGELKHKRVGRTRYFSEADLRAFMDAQAEH